MITRQHGCDTEEQRAALGHSSGWLVANISGDGGRTWISDTGATTARFDQAKAFTLVGPRLMHAFTAPTVELEPPHFLTIYVAGPDVATAGQPASGYGHRRLQYPRPRR